MALSSSSPQQDEERQQRPVVERQRGEQTLAVCVSRGESADEQRQQQRRQRQLRRHRALGLTDLKYDLIDSVALSPRW